MRGRTTSSSPIRFQSWRYSCSLVRDRRLLDRRLLDRRLLDRRLLDRRLLDRRLLEQVQPAVRPAGRSGCFKDFQRLHRVAIRFLSHFPDANASLIPHQQPPVSPMHQTNGASNPLTMARAAGDTRPSRPNGRTVSVVSPPVMRSLKEVY